MMETWPKLLKDTAGIVCFLHDHTILIVTVSFSLDMLRLIFCLLSVFQILGFQKDHFIEQKAFDSFDR